MKYIRNFLILTFAFLSFLALDANAQTPQNGIERKVFKELIKLPYYGVFDHIAFKVNGNNVTLYGKVANARNKKDAEDVVEDVVGEGNVINNIEILPPSSSDRFIRQRILSSFADKGLYRYLWEPNPSVRIVVDRGRVELEGYVANKGDFNLMNILANGVSGVFSVENNLVVGKEQNR
jgi:hyperosmotically inducible protein